MCLPRKAWELQGPEGFSVGYVDLGPCLRQCQPGRFQDLQGVPCSSSSIVRTGVVGWELEHCISSQPTGGTTFADDDGKAFPSIVAGPSLCGNGSATMECSGLGLHPRDGSSSEQKIREPTIPYPEEGGRDSVPKAEAKVPKKAEVPGRGKRQVRSSSGSGGSLPPYVHHDLPTVNSSSSLKPSFDSREDVHRGSRSGASPMAADLDTDSGVGDRTFCPDEPVSSDPKKKRSCSDLGASWSYLKWCANLVPMVLRSRTPLASFLSNTIRLSKASDSRCGLASTFFPVPIPFFGVFGRMSPSSSVVSRHARHISRAIHVIVMTLNFWHFGGRWCDSELLRREPNRQHESLYRRLRFLIKSDWPAEIPDLPKAGRKFPQLTACLSELSDCLTRLGPSANPYDKIFGGVDVPPDNSQMPELSPYRDLDPDRLRIKGTGKWDATEFLDDTLCMVYREPACIKFSEVPSVAPCIRDSSETIGKLARIWDIQGLLFLHERGVGNSSHVRVFNTLKSATQDRQIGDRRAMNSQEAKVCGPSSDLPAGCDLASLVIDPRHQSIAISITDRSDFYHQFMSTPSRRIPIP